MMMMMTEEKACGKRCVGRLAKELTKWIWVELKCENEDDAYALKMLFYLADFFCWIDEE